MRVIFNEGLKAVADDLDHMARDVRDAIRLAGEALLHQDLDAAQTVIDNDASIDDLSTRIMDQCVELLARQNPVATDLRVIVSTMRLATTFERMGDLARHIAESARRTYPNSPVPQNLVPTFAKMQQFLDITGGRLVDMLADRDTAIAEQIIRDDDQLDDLHLKSTPTAPNGRARTSSSSTWCSSHASWSVSATMQSPPHAASCSSSPASTPRRRRRETKAPTSTERGMRISAQKKPGSRKGCVTRAYVLSIPNISALCTSHLISDAAIWAVFPCRMDYRCSIT